MVVLCAGLLSVTALSAASAASGRSPASRSSGRPSGTLNVLQAAAAWPTLDPATNNQDAADSQLMNAIYGGLFEFGPHGKVIPDLASGYRLTDGNKTLVITMRPHLRFANGMALTAADVAASMKRDLLPANGCICAADFGLVSSITSSGSDVVLHMKAPYSAVVRAFDDTAPNWPIPMSLVGTKSATAKFEQLPVGAGPFGKVLHNTASAEVSLAANPYYWEKGKPAMAKLNYTSVGDDQSAYASLQTGQSQIAYLVSTVPVIKSAMQSRTVKVAALPATFYEFVSFNTKVPPFNNEKARQALLYATDAPALVKNLYGGLFTVSQGPTAPGEPFYQPKVPGYPSYNLSKAKALVKQLGGLSFKLATTFNTTFWTTEASYLTGMWSKAGINATVEPNSLSETLVQLQSGNWSALLSNWGALDPGVALPTYFASNGPFSGVHDPGLDALINAGVAVSNPNARAKLYGKVYADMASHAYADFLYSKPFFVLYANKVQGISNQQSDIFWEDVTLGR